MESYVIDLEEETKNYKNLLDEITKSHDIHKTLLLKNENLKNKQILSTKKIEELQNCLNKKDLEIKENLKEINDKNSIIEDFQGKFEDLEKLIETKDMLLKTAEFTNIELKSKIKNLEKDNKDLIKRLNEEYLNKKKDFEEIIKQSIEALKIFYLKFENNINNNYNFYLDFQDNQQNYNNSIGVDENFNSNHNFNFDKLEQNESLAYKKISTLKNLNFSKIKQVKNPYNTVVNDEDYETKSIYSKNDRINRSLSPIGKKGNNNSFSKMTINNNINSSKEKMNRTRYEKRSRSVIEKKIKIFNLKNLNFLKNDLFDFQDFFSLYENVKDDNSPPLKIIVEQALDNPLNHKLNQKKILRGDLQAFNFYYNFIKSEMFSGLLREWNIASFINEKLNPILKDYFSDNNSENKGPNVNKLLDKILNGINTLKNRLNEEELINKDLMQTIQNLKNEKKKLNSQLDEVEGNLGNLNILFFKNFDQLQEKINREKLSKENLLKEIDTLLSEIKKLKSEHKDLYEKLNEVQKKYFSQCGENEELNKELLDLKKRNQQKNELNYNHVTTEENFSFKGNKYDTEDYRQANTLNSQSGKTGDFLDYSQQDKLVSSNINNRELNFLQKENNIIKQELKKFGLDNDNLKYLLSKVEKDNEILRNNNIYTRFDSNLYIRRAVDIYFLSSFILPVNTLDYSNNNNRNSTEYNNILLREDELNKKIYLAELENSKLNNNILELSEKNQVLEYKLEKLTNKLGKFSNRYLSIHNNIRFNIETTQEYLFKKDLIEKNEEVNNKYYNIPTINYSIPNKDEEGGLCCVCKVQYQEVKSFRKSFKTNTYKELKQFYLGLNTDIEKIASKLDTIVVNFTRTSACFENEGNEEKKIKISQVKEILGTFGKMIGVLGNSLRKYQKDLSVQTGNLEKILEFIFRVVYSSMVYKEKFRAKVRDSKNMNSIASKSKYEESIKKSTINPSSYIVKLENYIFSFGKVYYLIENREIEEIRSFYNEKSFGDIVDVFKEYCEEIVKVYNRIENNEVGERNNSVILPQDGKREELINAKYNFDYGKEGKIFLNKIFWNYKK